jgi:hypothetical protein
VWPEYADDEQFRARSAREVEAVRKVGGFHTWLALSCPLSQYADNVHYVK